MAKPLPTEPAEAVGADLRSPAPSLIGASRDVPGPVSFAEQSYLSYLIPYKTNADIESLLQGARYGNSLADSIQQRESLYFGKLCVPLAQELAADSRQQMRLLSC